MHFSTLLLQATQEVVAEATSVLDQTLQQLGPLMAQLSAGQALEAALLQATLRWARQARQRLNRSAGVGAAGRGAAPDQALLPGML